jgi:ABC-2 type transport system ATP-binding protein
VIEVRHLTKKYGDTLAVSDLSFTIESGHIYGFLGPNGAGKSTTMNIMTGCLAATEGDVIIGGHDIYEEPRQAKKLIGYLPEQPPLYMDSTPREYLTFVARAKGVQKSELKGQIQKAMESTDIVDMADRLIRHLSKGYRQRVGIAQAILGDPEVVILDEPTVGLDPMQIIEIRDLIRELGKDRTVILSSHILSEIQAVCDRVIIISNGKKLADDSLQNLEVLNSGKNLEDIFIELTKKARDEALQAEKDKEVIDVVSSI